MAKVLIVDDSAISRKNLIQLIAAEKEHQVVGEAQDGKEALVKYNQLKPDLVTLDISMPRMNGLDALRKIIQQHPRARVIMITAMDQPDKIQEALENGAKTYINKPIDGPRLIKAFSDALA